MAIHAEHANSGWIVIASIEALRAFRISCRLSVWWCWARFAMEANSDAEMELVGVVSAKCTAETARRACSRKGCVMARSGTMPCHSS